MFRATLLLLLAAGLSLSGTSLLCAQQPKPEEKTVNLKVDNGYGATVMVELYQDGKLIRMREIPGPGNYQWMKLKPGRYEVHFMDKNHKPFIKRLLLSEDDTDQAVEVELTLNGGVVGGGVSLQELAEQIDKLKKENAELRAEIEKLKKK